MSTAAAPATNDDEERAATKRQKLAAAGTAAHQEAAVVVATVDFVKAELAGNDASHDWYRIYPPSPPLSVQGCWQAAASQSPPPALSPDALLQAPH